jgi:hypothetical protein
MQYPASLDTLALWTTIIVCTIFSGIGIWNLKSIFSKANNKGVRIAHVLTFLLLIMPPVYSYLYHPQKYVLGNFDLFIKRPIGDVIIHVKDIREMRPVMDYEMKGTIRTFGVGGLFGYFGNYHNAKIGSFTMYGSQRNYWVIIYTKQGDVIMLTPDDPIAFIDRVKMKMDDL